MELTAGTHELRLDMASSGFNVNYIDLVTPENIRVEAEDYRDDRFTSDQTFYDTDYQNQGGGYRDRSVDIEPTSDISGGFNVGWIESGEWLTYSVDIPYDGNYQVVGRVASDSLRLGGYSLPTPSIVGDRHWYYQRIYNLLSKYYF